MNIRKIYAEECIKNGWSRDMLVHQIESNYHLKEIFSSGELSEDLVVQKIRIVQEEGNRKASRSVEFYSLDAIIAVGYRVNSYKATQFRIWPNNVLKDYLVKGYK